MSKILVISPTPTHPQNEGNKARIYRMLKIIKQLGHEIHFLCVTEKLSDETFNLMKNEWDAVYRINKKITWLQKIQIIGLRKICRYLENYREIIAQKRINKNGYFLIDDCYHHIIDNEIGNINNKYTFDIVLVEYVFLSKAFLHFDTDTHKILDTHDIFSGRRDLFTSHGHKHSWFHTNKEQEAIGLNRADLIIAIQNKEKEFFQQLTNKKILTIGHQVEINNLASCKHDSYILLFVGSGNPVNQFTVNYFLDNVYPELLKKYNNRIQFYLVGNISEKIKNNLEGVVKIGAVADLKKYYKLADVVINPVQFGTGLKIKNIEALGFGKALMTTTVGAEGLEDGTNNAFVVADSSKDMADAISKLLTDINFRNTIEDNAIEYARNYNKQIENRIQNIFH